MGGRCRSGSVGDGRRYRSGSVGGVHGVDVAVQLVSEGQTGFGGEVDLGTPGQTAGALAVAAPGRGGRQTRLHVLCHWGALSALASLFTASVEGKTLQHLHTHDGRENCSNHRRPVNTPDCRSRAT